MSRTYKATGINLKSMPLGEADRLVTILTREFGIIRAVAPGARKQKSKLAGRSGVFVVNQLLVAKGRSLDKITQAESLESYPGLSKDLAKLAASQYLAELVLCYALSEQPQVELFEVFNEHLKRLEGLPTQRQGQAVVLAYLSQAVFHLLALAGIAPQVHLCCITQHAIKPDFSDPQWQVGFSIEAGGTVNLPLNLAQLGRIQPLGAARGVGVVQPIGGEGSDSQASPVRANAKLTAVEVMLLQTLAHTELPVHLSDIPSFDKVWIKLEQLLREYAQYHAGRSIRSAALLDALSPVEP